MIVCVPLKDALLAASIFVTIPPVPYVEDVFFANESSLLSSVKAFSMREAFISIAGSFRK